MSDRKVYNEKTAAPGTNLICGTVGSGTDGYATTGSGWSLTSHASGSIVIQTDIYPGYISAAADVIDPDTASTKLARVVSVVPSTGVVTIQTQTTNGTAGDILNIGATGLKVAFQVWFRNTDLTV